jgi:hypothetical protein
MAPSPTTATFAIRGVSFRTNPLLAILASTARKLYKHAERERQRA